MSGLIGSGAKFLLAAILLARVGFPVRAAELDVFRNVTLAAGPANDGDSFVVLAGEKRLHLRLYYVDCPETAMGSRADIRRVREQMRYFGLASADRIIHFGMEAKAFAARSLARPFTVYTAFATAPGRSSEPRLYGFVTTANGEDLASILVARGLARAHGVGRETPAGVPRKEMAARFDDLETSAMLKRAGIWSESDPDRIAQLRAEQRREENLLEDFKNGDKESGSPRLPLDVNTASEEELQAIPGIGPVLAGRIVAGRPYKTVDDLLRVRGIAAKTLEKIRPHLLVGREPR